MVPLLQEGPVAQVRAIGEHPKHPSPSSSSSLALPFAMDDFGEPDREPVTESARHTAATLARLLAPSADPVSASEGSSCPS